MTDSSQSIPEKMAQLMRELQDWGIQEIAARITRFGTISSTDEYMLTLMAGQDVFEREWKAELAKKLGVTETKIEELFTKASMADYIHNKTVFESAGIPFVPYEENVFVQSLTRSIIEQTQGDFANITKSVGFARRVNGKIVFEPIARYYQSEINIATTKTAAGLQTFGEAVKEAVVAMADSGMRTVSFASGRKDRIDVAARRAVSSAMRDLTNLQSEHNAEIMGVTTFEFSWHGGHRPSHGWGGRRYDRLGKHYPRREDVYAKYGGGTMEDYNCYHEIYAVFPDSPPKYTDAQLDKMESDELEEIEYEGEKYNAYAARQKQRAIERAMRRQRSLIAGYKAAQPELKEELQQAQISMTQLGEQYNAFSKAMGLRAEYERITTGLS